MYLSMYVRMYVEHDVETYSDKTDHLINQYIAREDLEANHVSPSTIEVVKGHWRGYLEEQD